MYLSELDELEEDEDNDNSADIAVIVGGVLLGGTVKVGGCGIRFFESPFAIDIGM